MKLSEDGYRVKFASGRWFPATFLIGLSLSEERCGYTTDTGEFSFFFGEEAEPLSLGERRELAEFMIARWRKFAEIEG